MSKPISNLIVALLVSGAIAVTGMCAGRQADEGQKRLQRLIDQLGSRKFADRDRAMKQLQAVGPAALPVLRRALQQSQGLETRRRIQSLVSKLEDTELAAKLIKPRRLRLKVQGATVAQAVVELARVSGYPIHLSDKEAAPSHKITLDTGETTFWDAFEKLCSAAGLVENQAVMGPFDGEQGAPRVQNWRDIIKAAPGIHLKAGKAAKVPSCLVGSVRIRLLKAQVSSERTVDLVLEVSGEPRLRGLGLAHAIQVDTVRDGHDKVLAVTSVPVPAARTRTDLLNHRGSSWVVILIDNTVLKGNCFATAPPVGEGPFVTRVRFTLPEKVRRFKELTGKLVLRTTVEAKMPLTIPNILQAPRQSVKGADGSQLIVEEVEPLPNRDIRLKLAWQRLIAGNGLLGIKGAVGGKMVMRNTIEITGVTPDRSPAVLADAPLLLDRDGKAYLLAEWLSHGWTITGNSMTHKLTLLYRPQPGQGRPDRLLLPGQRTFGFVVPFRFTDVVLP